MIRIRGVLGLKRPFYWGVEDVTEDGFFQRDRSWLTWATMVEDQEPWRKSIGAFRIRIGRYGLHIGLCRRQKESERPWHGRYAPVTEISKWRRLDEPVGNQTEVADGEAIAAPEQIRPAE